MSNSFFNIISSVILCLALSSCDYYSLDDPEPIDGLPTDGTIVDFASVQSARNGIYNELQLDNTFDGYLASWQYFSDECDWTGTFPTREEFDILSVNPANTTLGVFFTDFYEIINAVNFFLDRAPRVDDAALTEALLNTYLGEARFARAYAYFHLVQGWEEVPLVLTPTLSAGDELFVTKNTKAEVEAQIMEDLNFAEANIGSGNIGITSQVVTAFKARMALYQGRYADALALADSVLVLGGVNDLARFPYPTDVIFSIDFESFDGNDLGFFYAPSALGGRLSIAPSATLINAYEEGDTRFDLSIGFLGNTAYGLKYDDFGSAAGAQRDPLLVFRYAEMFLIGAEAAAQLGDFETASDAINVVRDRAGLDNVTLDAGNFLDLILQERFVELAMEGGHRLWDLRRTGRAIDVLGPIGYDGPCDDFWPLPLRDIDRNPNLVQNDCCNC